MQHDLTPPEHQHSDAVLLAATWLSSEKSVPNPIITAIRGRFGLSVLEACEAAALSSRYRAMHWGAE